MIVLIDAGNTRLKLGWVDPGTGRRESHPLAMSHHDLHQLAAWLDQLTPKPRAALGVNVAGKALADALDELFRLRCGRSVSWISGQAQATGVRNAYDTPAQLGADRWVSMIGLARHAQGGPLLLASFGTATTLDTLGPEQRPPVAGESAGRLVFHGGLILPGPALMRSALATGTANLPEANATIAAYPTHTRQAISSGIAAAQAGALLRQWREGLERFGQPPRVYSTGGAWSLVEDEVQRGLARAQGDLNLPRQAVQWLPSPALDGLARLALSGAG
ncbi:type III pantothenate kinase [Pollutimonas sp. H1-120]|uniref:type III pantothenate kinase n=1 Tax=Pollutimonas sp. H1-120 TaxID=3148824 RepID=UPI003B520D52